LSKNELSHDEINMFGLTSSFGSLYEGHIIRLKTDTNDQTRFVLLLASTHHVHVQPILSDDLLVEFNQQAHAQVRLDSVRVIEFDDIDY
jgi:hypothetical protein